MKMRVYTKEFFKEERDIRNAVIHAVCSLYDRISLYEKQNVPFEKIFNDEKVKYDKHGSFYTFKTQCCNVQLRLLYAYMITDGVPTVVVVDYIIKKKNNKNYIKRFEAASKLDVLAVYRKSKDIAI